MRRGGHWFRFALGRFCVVVLWCCGVFKVLCWYVFREEEDIKSRLLIRISSFDAVISRMGDEDYMDPTREY